MVLNGLTRCCVAFDAKFTAELFELFLDRLSPFTPEQVGAAFALAIDECERMPRIKHILARIDHGQRSSQTALDVKIVGITREPFDEQLDLKVWKTEDGARLVRIVRRDPFALPAKPEFPMSEADKLNFHKQMQLAAGHMKIPYIGLSESELQKRRELLRQQAEQLKSGK